MFAKFIPNTSELYKLNESEPHVYILKIVKILFEYGVLKEDQIKEFPMN